MDLQVAASGGGYGHTECPQGIPVEFALLSILAAFGVAFGVLFMALTQQTMGRRRRRSADGDDEDAEGVVGDLAFKFGDILWAGEFTTRNISCLPKPFLQRDPQTFERYKVAFLLDGQFGARFGNMAKTPPLGHFI